MPTNNAITDDEADQLAYAETQAGGSATRQDEIDRANYAQNLGTAIGNAIVAAMKWWAAYIKTHRG